MGTQSPETCREKKYAYQSSIQNKKHQVSHKYSCFSWWWAHSRPKHVEKRNTHTSHPYRIRSTKCRINTIVSPDDGHIVARNIERKEINILGKILHKVGFICKFYFIRNFVYHSASWFMYWRSQLIQCTCVVVPNTGVPLECDSFLMTVIKYGLRIRNAKKKTADCQQ